MLVPPVTILRGQHNANQAIENHRVSIFGLRRDNFARCPCGADSRCRNRGHLAAAVSGARERRHDQSHCR